MASPRFPILRPGQVPTAAAWNELVRAISAMSNVNSTAFGDLGVNSGGSTGTQIVDGRLKKHWAKITSRGAGNLYAHTAVAPQSDGTFVDLPQNPDNPYGTANANDTPAREVNGRIDFDDSLPLYAELWLDEPGLGWKFDAGGATSGNVNPTPCEPHGWLLDRQALIDTNKYFDVQVFAGAGRCACIVDQGRDPGGFPYPWQAKYNATANKWLLMEKIATCCDNCVQLKLDVNETTGVMTGQLVGTTACDASGAFTYDLVEMCSGRGYVLFGAAGVKLCNTTLDPTCQDDQCDNSFLILVTCDCCTNTNVTCDRCCTCTGPPFVLFNLTGFSGANAFLNALWVLPYQGNCTWGFTCNGTTFAYAITYDGANTTHLTFTISGIATYEYDIVAGDTQISCFVNRTLTRTSGDAGSTPGTVLMEPFTCDTTPSACFKGVSTSDQLFFQFHDCTGDAACLNGLVVPLTYGVGSCAGTGLSSWQGTFSDCTAPGTTGDICITCNTGGADNTCPLVMNINFKDMDCTGPFGIVSWTCDPFVLEVQYSNFCFFGAMKGRFTTTHP